MKLNEITEDLIDEMLSLHPIRGILTYQKLQKLDEVHFSFHQHRGWFHFYKRDLSESNRFFKEQFKNDKVEIKKTKKGFLYFFYDQNQMCFFKRDGKREVLKVYGVSLNFSNGIIKNNHTGFLISKGVNYFVRKFVIPFNKNGEMMIGRYEEKYF